MQILSLTTPVYIWQYKVNAADSTFNFTDSKPNVFAANYTPSMTVTNTNPTLSNNLNIHKMKVFCTAIISGRGCAVTSDTFTFKSSATNIILKPTPSRCNNEPAVWQTPAPTPTNGAFIAYNTTNNLLRTQIDTTVGGVRCFKKWKFAIPSTYKIIYTAAGADSICSETTYMTTYGNCATLGTTHKLYINEVHKDGTAFRNGGANNPCNTMKVNFTALGNFVVGDTLKIKISDINGKVNTQIANIRKRIVGQYVFTASATNKTDSVKIENMKSFVDTTSTNYRVQMFLKKKGVNTIPEWGDKNIENLYFFRNKACPSVGGGVCCQGTGRTAPNNFVEGEIQLYPNPTTDRFTLQTPEYDNATEVSISDTQGRLISKQNIYTTTNEIETHEMSNGIYYVRIAQGERSTVLKLVVIK